MYAGIALLLIAVVVGAAILLALLSSADFTIGIGGGQVRVKGRISGSLQGEIADFFEREFSPELRATIRGWRQGGDRLRLRFRGNLPEGDRQRIRNFLVLTLCR